MTLPVWSSARPSAPTRSSPSGIALSSPIRRAQNERVAREDGTAYAFGRHTRRGGRVTFTGWRAEALEFFDRLEEENTKAFWERNKGTYETLVRGPMEELLSELQKDWGTGRIFRPYRDVRSS